MPDSKQLHHDAETLRQKVQAKRDDADNAIIRAANFRKDGELERAAQENARAIKDHQEILEIERAAMECEFRATELEAKELELEKHQTDY